MDMRDRGFVKARGGWILDISFWARLNSVLERLSNGIADGLGDYNHTALERSLATRAHLQNIQSPVQDKSHDSEL